LFFWEIGFTRIPSHLSVDIFRSLSHFFEMKVAKKSPASRRTLTLSGSAFEMLEDLCGSMPKSVYVQNLIVKQKQSMERADFYRQAVAAYTPDVRKETLELNEATPVAAE
jgi:hypothetical protein